MENRRIILIALLAVTIFFMYQAWQDDYGKQAAPTPTTASLDGAVTVPAETDPGAGREIDSDTPTAVPAAPAADVTAGTTGDASSADEMLTVETDVLRAKISLRGGEIRSLELKHYPLSKDQPDVALPLLSDSGLQYAVFQSGLAGTGEALASGDTPYRAAQTEYRLAEGSNVLEVRLEHERADGVKVSKTYRFGRSSYRIGLEHGLDNGSAEALTVSPYTRFVRNEGLVGDLPKFVMTFLGIGFYENKPGSDDYRFVKTKLDNLDDDAFETRQKNGWISILQHYFVVAILPPRDSEGVYSAKPARDGRYTAQYVATGVSVEAGSGQRFVSDLYVGPRLQDGVKWVDADGQIQEGASLDAIAPGLDYTIDYGILTPICEPLFWLLEKFHSFTGNWGVAIILLTLVVKALFYKLSEAQYRSMAKMKKFAPRIQDIKERYDGDRERMSKAMMDLYKKEGFNPLAGCWPLLVQFPVFIALYWVLLESVELRQADFALWINDLSAPDPFYVLPVLFGISFYVQQKWSGATATMDPMQQKIMNVMPIMMTAFFAFFQAGLVLYWLVSNLIGMAQQWFINRKLAGEGLGRAKPA
ncbi:membrane protein insertase YidC [Panacagrimonas sp.]|uniref:membrane protein insertase YidC n=1 Tax=Panacagrimonas sp. TaxID=2480088 RepID=UPI003B5209C1